MSTRVQRRRGTTAEHSTFTGAVGEITVNTDTNTVVVHDGSTAGGFPIETVAAPTGATSAYIGSTAPTGWILASGKTLGNGSSGGTERANADTESLFTLLYDSWADSEAPVSGGRGANAAADFAADKTITVPDLRGRVPVGLDNLGGSTASRITGGGAGITGTTLGDAGGSQTHPLTETQLASHDHNMNVSSTNGGVGSPGGAYLGTDSGGYHSGFNTTMASNAIATAGSGSAHQNTQPSIMMGWIIKL